MRHNPRLVAQGAIGQNIVAATPLQMAMVGAAIANKGRMMAPRLVLSVGRKRIAPELMSTAMGEETAARLTYAMTAVMTEGTGKALPGIYRDADGCFRTGGDGDGHPVAVAAKTGTAEVEGKAPHAWFLAFAPASDPKAVVCVFLENGGWGAGAAGPPGMTVLAAALNSMVE